MKKIFIVLLGCSSFFFYDGCNSDNSDSISKDPASIAAGQNSFLKYCSGCHNFRQDGIGPQLSGVTKQLPLQWIKSFVHDPQKVIQSGDNHATSLYKEYKTMMPSFAYVKDDELRNIIAFMNTHQEKLNPGTEPEANALTDPIPQRIPLSRLVAQLQLVTQVPASSDSSKLPLARITKLDFQPGTGKIFVVDLRGKLYQFDHGRANIYMDISKLEPNFINEPGLATGFGSFACSKEIQ